MTFGYEVMAMFKRSKPQQKPQPDSDKMLVELWRAENEARKTEGLPPIPWEVWLEWYKWRQKVAQQGDRL
jgi:hypothetical protein